MPQRRDGLIERELADELLVYDPLTNRAYLLNRVSAAIWGMCDGRHSAHQIAERIARTFSVPVERVLEDVEAAVEHLCRDGLLIASNAPPETGRW